jgi:hypothetical protein
MNSNVKSIQSNQKKEVVMSLCPLCGKIYCDHTSIERDQTPEEMSAELTPDELVACHSFTYPYAKVAAAIRNRGLQHLTAPTVNVGVSCEEYSLLVIAGPNSNELPKLIRKRMRQHEKACEYHNIETWHQSAIGTPVTRAMEVAAGKVIKKYIDQLNNKSS